MIALLVFCGGYIAIGMLFDWLATRRENRWRDNMCRQLREEFSQPAREYKSSNTSTHAYPVTFKVNDHV